MNELKPCPFCGGKPLALGCHMGFTVECTVCGAITAYYRDEMTTNDKAEQLAINAWNKRNNENIGTAMSDFNPQEQIRKVQELFIPYAEKLCELANEALPLVQKSVEKLKESSCK